MCIRDSERGRRRLSADVQDMATCGRLCLSVSAAGARVQCRARVLVPLMPSPPRDDDKPPRRVITTPRGVPVLRPATERGAVKHRDYSEWDEDITGKYEGQELEQARAKRPTDERIKRLEVKHDKLDEKVDRIELTLTRVDARSEEHTRSQAEMTSLLR